MNSIVYVFDDDNKKIVSNKIKVHFNLKIYTSVKFVSMNVYTTYTLPKKK